MTRGSLFGLALREYFAGGWRIERLIEDRRAGTVATFEGAARFGGQTGDVQTGDALRYDEDGILSMNGAQFPAARAYLWSFTDGGADVAFGDGRPFHRMQPKGNEATARHDCPPDLYRVHYTFETPDRWRQGWIVTGPRKDYTLESVFTRLHPSADPVHPALQ